MDFNLNICISLEHFHIVYSDCCARLCLTKNQHSQMDKLRLFVTFAFGFRMVGIFRSIKSKKKNFQLSKWNDFETSVRSGHRHLINKTLVNERKKKKRLSDSWYVIKLIFSTKWRRCACQMYSQTQNLAENGILR